MRHLGRVLLGYLLACLATAFGLTVAGEVNHYLTLDAVARSLYEFSPLESWVRSTRIGFLAIAFFAALPSALVIALAEWKPVSNRIFYVATGTLMGGGLGYFMSGMLMAGLILGPLAGWIYWRIAGRHAGSSR